MRISTQTFYDQGQSAMGSQQLALFRIQQKVATGRNILSPSDDPVGAARALNVSQSLSEGSQYAASRTQAMGLLSREDDTLQSVATVLQNVKAQIVAAGNGTMSDADRASLATTIQSQLDQLVGMANTDDGNGQFLFAGFKSTNAPFAAQAGGGYQYLGDQGQRLMQVDVARQMPATDDGRSIFLSVQGGAGYVTSAPSSNTGTGVFSAVGVTDATAADYGKDFSISFAGGNYTVQTKETPPTTVATGAYTAGSPISFGGVQISVTGAPADGDSFDVSTARNAGTDVFAAMEQLVTALRQPLEGGGDKARADLLNALSTANVKITNAHDNVLTVRSSVGSRMNELDQLDSDGEARKLIDKSYLSEIEDLDYYSALSEFTQRQTSLQAAQQTFVSLSGLALFKYL
ncbi:flagellar hook-associated protein FlgL [Variovorax sp. OV329]|uniref:flagellar hook-associated protein FlgL n=1 Tax=Variovorax sp. OV329 TaxID=1882825 RepID=UPI0008E98786|nr:flagellar hook-associated protein FlgL [Variovorax sp. OV329]SFN17807.1 flagellar hook-associated protein 3 FlgL [Variovorax sp. OV329]